MGAVLRGALSILIGVALALLLAAAAQFLLAPLVGTAGLGALRVIDLIVFWVVLLLVVLAVVRRPRA